METTTPENHVGQETKTLEDEVVRLIRKKFAELPKKFKPLKFTGSTVEWVVLSGIVLTSGRRRCYLVPEVCTDPKQRTTVIIV